MEEWEGWLKARQTWRRRRMVHGLSQTTLAVEEVEDGTVFMPRAAMVVGEYEFEQGDWWWMV